MTNWLFNYAQKRIAIEKLAAQTTTTIHAYCEQYRDQQVNNKVNKAELFRNSLTGKYTANETIYLLEQCKIPHKQDNRTPLQYATDLIIGWLSEDIMCTIMQNAQLPAQLTGTDQKRNFLADTDIDNQPDITINGTKVELLFDYTNHWARTNTLDIRDNKFTHLKNNGTLLLGVAPHNTKALLIDPTNLEGVVYGEIPAYGKMGYTIPEVKNRLAPISEVIEDLKSRLSDKSK